MTFVPRKKLDPSQVTDLREYGDALKYDRNEGSGYRTRGYRKRVPASAMNAPLVGPAAPPRRNRRVYTDADSAAGGAAVQKNRKPKVAAKPKATTRPKPVAQAKVVYGKPTKAVTKSVTPKPTSYSTLANVKKVQQTQNRRER